MKKFLSLVLALVMTMSLATISAGATEYQDLTDKDEIQYEEAVAVLNRIGIITGYEDGSFRPETELTRGAAAKIIVSLMIGPEAASNLSNSTSPYPDVPAGHTFAGVISYCKTAGYISGYGDGTFKPANSLTGYAFAKMLLGAVGYKGELEGFTGTGWTMNVARLGNEAQLFNRLDFAGADAVNREQACQLALNTLKATMVEYTGGVNINTAGGDSMTVAPTRTYKTSNQSYAANISNRKLDSQGNAKDDHYTVEFGEEHFKDLRLDDDHQAAKDDFGRPANVWSYKKVTIGTFPVAPDFTFDKQMAHADKTDAVKNRATGLSGYTLKSDEKDDSGNAIRTTFWVNGTEYTLANDGKWDASCPETNSADAIRSGKDAKISNISDLTDNGTIVEVYVSEDEADFITDVVVVKSQLMEVKKVGSDYVSLEKKNPDDSSKNFPGFNQNPIDVKVGNVQAEDAAYSVLKDLKAEDSVVVIPVDADHDGKDFEVAEAYVPETVSGALTGVRDYGPTNDEKNAIALTVGGTEYGISLWNKDMAGIDGDQIKVTKKDVSLTLDKHGYALLAEDVGATSEWMVIGSFRSAVENGRVVTIVTGWDISGEAIELNIGPAYTGTEFKPGDLVKYESNGSSNIRDWDIKSTGVYNVYTGEDENTGAAYRIKASNVKVDLLDYASEDALYIDKGVKFIYVTFDVDGEVESIEVKKGVQAVENDELRTTAKGKVDYVENGETAYHIDNYNSAQAAVTDKGAIKAVVIKQESNDADSASMLYIRDMPGGAEYDKNGKMVYTYTVAMNGKDGLVDDEMTIYSYDRLYRGDFASYAEMENADYDKSPFYSLRTRNNFLQRTTSTFQADIMDIVNVNQSLVELDRYGKVGSGAAFDEVDGMPANTNISQNLKSTLGIGDEANIVSLANAVFVDLTKHDIDSFDDLKDVMFTKPDGTAAKWRMQTVEAQLVVNDNAGNDGFRKVSMIIITDVKEEETAEKGNNTLLSANIKGEKFDAPAASQTTSTLTQKDLDSSKKISFSHNGKSIEVKVDGAVMTNDTMKLSVGNVITVVVEAADGTKSSPYTFTIGAVAAPTYANTVAAGLGVAAANDASSEDWDAIDAGDVSIDGTPELTAPVVLTGDDDDTIEQLKMAMEFLDEEYTTIAKGFDFANDHTWIITTPKGQVKFDEANAHVYATFDGTKKILAAGSIGGDDGGLTANYAAKETLADGTVNVFPTSTDDVKPGASYVDKAYLIATTASLNALKVDAASSSVWGATAKATYTVGVTLPADAKVVAANTYLPVGSEIVITITPATVPGAGESDTFAVTADADCIAISGTAVFDENITAGEAKTITVTVNDTLANHTWAAGKTLTPAG